MKILYIANVRMPTEKAHGIQIIKTCEALVRAGAELELIVPTRHNPLKGSAFAYYGMPESFPITYLNVPDTVGWGRLGFMLQTILFAHAARIYLREKETSDAIIYGRDEQVLARLIAPGRTIVWETHTGAWSAAAQVVAKRAQKIIAISGGLKDAYIERGVPAEKIIVAHDAVDLEDFRTALPKSAARTKLGLPQDVFTAAYIGKLTAEKGSPTYFEAVSLLPDGMLGIAVGGTEHEVRLLAAQYPKVRFLGPRPYRELPDIQAVADVLVLPNTAASDVSARYTSPLKLFTAMASGTPIVASDVPSIREVLDDSMAYFVPADDASALAAALQRVAQEPQTALVKAEQARVAAARYTWDTRAHTILDALSAPATV